jgi:hypothetical protein
MRRNPSQQGPDVTYSPTTHPTETTAADRASSTRKFSPQIASLRVMSRKYEIRSGRRTVSVQRSSSPLQAALDYVRMFGSGDSEITILGVDRVAWRGAQFSAVPVPPEPRPAA